MALGWSTRRQILYYGAAILALALLTFAVWKIFLTSAPTCSDNAQNGTETGVDCGGTCSLVCKEVAHTPVVLWARIFVANPHTYTAAAYIQNNNVGAGARRVHYTFQLFDEKNSFVVAHEGVVDIPPVQIVPIIDSNIDVGNRIATRVLFAFSDEPTWNKIPTGTFPTLRITNKDLAQDGSRLSVTLVNDSVNDAGRTVLAAVLFDAQGVARAASKAQLSDVPHGSSQDVVFTWPTGVSDIVRAEITILPSF